MFDLYEELRAITRALGRARSPYALADGLAVGVYAAPRATEDLDLLLAEDRVTRRILSERIRRGGLWAVPLEGLRTLKRRRGSAQDRADLDALARRRRP